MDRTALVRTLVMSERDRATVTIRTINRDKPVVGAVQKVLNQIIILKSAASAPVTLMFADIVTVDRSESFCYRLLRYFRKTLHR